MPSTTTTTPLLQNEVNDIDSIEEEIVCPFFEDDDDDETNNVENQSLSSEKHNNLYYRDKRHIVKNGIHTVKRKFDDKIKNIRFFDTSFTPGAPIRHAITGLTYGGRVGRLDENDFFKVIFATGEIGRNSMALFYDTPKEFEYHFGVKVKADVYRKWNEKQKQEKTQKIDEVDFDTTQNRIYIK